MNETHVGIAIEFDRIGRTHNPPPIHIADLTVENADWTMIAEAVHRHARKYLASSWFEVSVDLEKGEGLIEVGRFGEFTIKNMVTKG